MLVKGGPWVPNHDLCNTLKPEQQDYHFADGIVIFFLRKCYFDYSFDEVCSWGPIENTLAWGHGILNYPQLDCLFNSENKFPQV